MSQERPKRKISSALQAPNLGDGSQLETIKESSTLKNAVDGQQRKISTDHGNARRVSYEQQGPRRISASEQSDSGHGGEKARKMSNFSVIGRKTSFMMAPEKMMINKVGIIFTSCIMDYRVWIVM